MQVTSDPQVSERILPANLRDNRTLIVEEGATCCGHIKFVADGAVDRYVQVTSNERGTTTAITAHHLGRGAQCTPEARRQSALLAQVGRTDECMLSETLSEVPDGLLLRYVWKRPDSSYFYFYCCSEGQFIQRIGGVERQVASWWHGERRLLTYLPLGYMFQRGVRGLWAFDVGGPYQIADVGGPAFHTAAMAEAVYGMTWNGALAPARIDTEELRRRAAALLASEDSGTRVAAINLILSLQAQGKVDDDLIRMAASLIGYDHTIREKISKFRFGLTTEQNRVFIDHLFKRLEDPNEGPLSDFAVSAFDVIGPETIIAAYRGRAEEIFVDRRDLRRWQYQLALRIAVDIRSYRNPEVQERLFRSLRDDTTPAFPRRALTFTTVFIARTDDERRLFARRLDLVPDSLLETYVRQAGWNRTLHEKETSGATHEFRRKARERAARATDDLVRRNALNWRDN